MRATHTGASRANVDSTDVRTAAALTFSELMQARSASVNVLMSGGRLVDGGHFLIRGPSTLMTQGAPMLIVDGMRMAEQEDDGGSTSSRLDDLAIEDIATVEVLRGPSAAALFGAGASSGVIVVTTKRGRAGRPHGRVHALSELRQDAGHYADRFRRPAIGGSNYSCSLVRSAARFCVPGTLERWNPLDEAGVFQAGLGAVASLDLSGGTSTNDARLSTTMRHANGITRGDQLSQLTARLNATQRVGRWAELTGHVGYYGNNTLGSVAGEVIQGVPFYWVGATPVDSFRKWVDYEFSSPAIGAHLYHMTTGADLALRPTTWLTLRVATTRDHVTEAAGRTIVPFYVYADRARYIQDARGSGFEFVQRSSIWNTHRAERATAEVMVPLLSILRADASVIVGSEREWRRRSQSSGASWRTNPYSNFAQARSYSNDGVFAFGRVQFADRLAFTGGARKEKETGAEQRYSTYPTGSASLQLPPWILGAQPRLRVAYGESAQRYAASSPVLLNGEMPVVENWGSPLQPSQPPERMKELEGGIDVDWGASGGVAVTVYRRTVANVAYESYPAGVLALASNGVELDAHAAIVRRSSVKWDVRGVIATNANRVTTDSIDAGFLGASLVTGYPVGVVQQRPYSFSDANGDGAISLNEVIIGRSKERFGSSAPTLSMALHSELQLGRRFTLRGVIDRRNGAWAESGYVSTLCKIPEESCQEHQDPSTSLGDQARRHEYSTRSPSPSFDASFTRLREVSLRWTIDAGRTIAGAPGMRVVVSGRDLATWSSWPGPDPEISSNTRGAIARNDRGAVPLPRRVMLGVEFDY